MNSVCEDEEDQAWILHFQPEDNANYEEELFSRLYRALRIADTELVNHADTRTPEDREATGKLIAETKEYFDFDD